MSWKNESYKHRLASKGIKTNSKNYRYISEYGNVISSFVNRDSPEWNYMWEELAKHPINQGLPEPTDAENHFEVWQYMGTNPKTGNHEFRHRNHPKTGNRENIYIKPKEKPVVGILYG